MRVYIASRISLYIDRYRTTVEQCIVLLVVHKCTTVCTIKSTMMDVLIYTIGELL
jgi:hypothetical protein